MTTADEDSRSIVLDVTIAPTTLLSALRGHLTTSLQDLGEDHRYDILLVVTELVTNVLEHTPGTGRLRVLRSKAKCEVTIEVDDTSALPPEHGRSRLGGTRGIGIVAVNKIAREWGTRPSADGGKTVFASVRCANDETSAGRCPPTA